MGQLTVRPQEFFPRRASWLAGQETELFSFPASRHDDQVDSISQALAHEISYGWNENNLRNLERFVAGLGGWRLR
jgi:phage terminase large subunit-like protein